jgi:hypothetical protein
MQRNLLNLLTDAQITIYLSFLTYHTFSLSGTMSFLSCTGVAMEACEFWSALSDDNDAHGVLQSHLATLIPSLISRLQLKEEQILQVRGHCNSLKVETLFTGIIAFISKQNVFIEDLYSL